MIGGLCNVLRGVSTKVLWEVVPKKRGQNSEKSDQKFLGEMGWWDVGEIWRLRNG